MTLFALIFFGLIILYAISGFAMASAREKGIKKVFREKAAQMSAQDLSVRLNVLFDELEDRYNHVKLLEYMALMKEYRSRPQAKDDNSQEPLKAIDETSQC